ncbi:MAG TPA: DUF6152 family protein [Caulobacteraceae bacterium]|jgi:hypothetical protein|nr:DUF6152 family protein [Caulobacteraceae bacterium]
MTGSIFSLRTGLGLAAACAAAATAGSALAHHSFAMFDNAKSVDLQGTVREFQWTNPHSWIQLTVMEGGQSVEYSIEGGSPNGLARRGWTRTSLKPGDRVTVTVHPLKDGTKGGSFVKAVMADGKALGAG